MAKSSLDGPKPRADVQIRLSARRAAIGANSPLPELEARARLQQAVGLFSNFRSYGHSSAHNHRG
jgi:hypothetical protein